MIMSSVKTQTINSTKWNALEKVTVQGIQFVLTLIMARLLLPSDYGTVGMLAIFISVSQSFIDSGFNTALIRKPDATEKDFCTVFYFNVGIAVVVYIFLFFLAPYVAQFFRIPILCSVLRVYAISLFINSFMAVQVAMLHIKLDFKSLAKRNVCATLISGVFGILLAYFGCGIWALVFQNIIASIINLIFICYICRWYPKSAFSMESFRQLGAFGSRILASSLLNQLYKNLTTFAIGKFYSPNDLGFYTRGAHYAHLPNQSINGVLSIVTYPILARIQNDDSHLLNVYKRYIQISSMCIFIISGLLCALAKPIVLLTLTDKWENSIIYLQLFAFSCMFDHLNTINLNLLKVKGRSELFFKLEVVKKTISLAILACAIPFGVLAICLSKLLYNQIAVFINTYYTGKLLHYGYTEQFSDFLPYFIRVVIACLPAFFLTFVPIPYIFSIFFGGGIGLGLYCFMLRKDKNMLELFFLIKSKFYK